MAGPDDQHGDETDAAEPDDAGAPVRSEAAICAMCVAVLRRTPSLGFVTGVEVRRIEQASGPNWDLDSIFPHPSRAQWQTAVDAIQPWRLRFNLA